MRHGDEVAGRIPWQIFIEPGADHQIVLLSHDHFVATGGRLDRLGDADGATGAGFVFDHEIPLVLLGELVGYQARHDVRTPGGRERHDHADRFTRIITGLCLGQPNKGKRQQGDRNNFSKHGRSLFEG